MRRITVGFVVAALALVAALPVSAAEGNNGNGVSGDPIAAQALDNPDLGQLVAALQYVDAELEAGLVDLFLNGKDQFTVFAPTDDAFEALYSTLDQILDPYGIDVEAIEDVPAPIVLAVLEYHVTDGRRFSNSVLPKGNNDKTVETIGGGTFTVNADKEIFDVWGQTAAITSPNLGASNGVIHVIDTVILPIDQATLLDLLGLS